MSVKNFGAFSKLLSHASRSRQFLQKAEPSCVFTAKRYLFSHDRLGVENFKRHRAFHYEKMGHMKEKFCQEVSKVLEQKDSVVFTADLKTMVHLAENDQDLQLMNKMIKLYEKQQTDLSFAHFNFGPLVMRILYILDRPADALELYLDEDLKKSGFFDQIASQVVLLDMLFENERYDDMHSVMEIVGNKQLGGVKYPLDCTTLVLAACLKQNSMESYDKMLEYLRECQEKSMTVSHRGLIYGALLALKQGKYNEAMEILSLAPTPYGRKRQPQAFLNLKLLTYIKVGKLEEALLVLRSVLENDVPDHVKTGSEIFMENLAVVEDAVTASGNKELLHQYESLKRGLAQGNHLVDSDFEAYTFRPIITVRRYQDGYKQRRQAQKNKQHVVQR